MSMTTDCLNQCIYCCASCHVERSRLFCFISPFGFQVRKCF